MNDATLNPAPIRTLPAIFTDGDLKAMRACKILVVDDEQSNVRLLERVLICAGFENFISTTDSREAATLFIDFQPDLVLTDWLMPEIDGCALIEQLRSLMASDDYLPVVVLTADITPQARRRALAAGATDFLTKPFDQIEVLLRIQNLLKARLSHLVTLRQNATLEESVRQRTIALERALSELQRTQQQIVQQERLAALGTMAGGIAHDFNNALCIIMGFGELLLRDAEHGLTKENATPTITTILTAAEDAASIVHRLREFYRPDEALEPRCPVNLNVLIEQAINLTQPRWQTAATAEGRAITVSTDLGEIPCIEGDPAELREAFTNLIFNAVDALPQGGTVSLRSRREGEGVVLTITDSGIGMSENVRQRCFEPFFSTKGKFGTGLGLSMVFGIIQRHAGTVEIDSRLGTGTTFTVRLAIPAIGGVSVAEYPLPASGPLRILVVDDQPILCHLLRQHLEDDRHIVESFICGSDALKRFRVKEFDLVITDHVMAEMTGEQLAAAIKEINPRTPVILLTGYGGNSSPKSAGEAVPLVVDLILSKPLSRSGLRHALTKVMFGTKA